MRVLDIPRGEVGRTTLDVCEDELRREIVYAVRIPRECLYAEQEIPQVTRLAEYMRSSGFSDVQILASLIVTLYKHKQRIA